MTKETFQPIDKELNEVHSLLSRLMESSVGYKLTQKDIDELDVAEEVLNRSRSALWRYAEGCS